MGPDSQQTSSQPDGGKEQQAPKEESKPAPPKQESKPEPPKQKEEPKKESKETSKSESPYGSRGENRVKMNRMRLRIAERLKQSQNTAASLTTFNEVDMSAVMDL